MGGLRGRVEPVAKGPASAALRFTGGFVLGLIIIPGVLAVVLLGGGGAVLKAWTHGPEGPFESVGAELSRAGATSVVWRRSGEAVRQTCRADCDDIEFTYGPAPKATEVSGAKDSAWRPRVRPVAGPVL